MKKCRRVATASPVVAALVAGLLGATATIAHAQQPHYYILIGGTCDGNAAVYNLAWLRGGIPRIVHYPAGGEGLCNGNTPMDQSVAQGYEEAKRVVRAAYSENPGALFTVVEYSQGAIVGNQVLNDIADGKLGVNNPGSVRNFTQIRCNRKRGSAQGFQLARACRHRRVDTFHMGQEGFA